MPVLILIVCGIAGVYHFLNRTPPPPPPPPPPAPVAAPVAVKVEPTPPSLKRIAIRNRFDINNAAIKEISKNGILFQCDEGLVQAQLTDLPEDFQSYYGNAIKEAAANAPRQNSIVRQPNQYVQQSNQYQSPDYSYTNTATTEETAADKARQKMYLKDKIIQCEGIIDRYLHQSSTTTKAKNQWRLITTEEYDYAKAELADAQAKYNSYQ